MVPSHSQRPGRTMVALLTEKGPVSMWLAGVGGATELFPPGPPSEVERIRLRRCTRKESLAGGRAQPATLWRKRAAELLTVGLGFFS